MLKDSSKDAIKTIISNSFDKFKSSFIGPQIAKGYVFALKHPVNQKISDAYVHANIFNSMKNSIDKNTIAHLESTASNYIDSLKQKATADIIKTVDDRLAEAYSQGKLIGRSTDEYLRSQDGQEILNSIKKALSEHEEKITKGLDLIANVSLYDAQNYGAADGIIDMSKSLGIPDPIVFKIGLLDDKRCPICWSLWTQPDRITPKVYKMSELVGGYMDRKNPLPTIGTSHPNCRDVLTFLSPGFGFEGGKIKYKGQGWNEFQAQRSGL